MSRIGAIRHRKPGKKRMLIIGGITSRRANLAYTSHAQSD
jgi:hypothetical protein